MGGLLIREGRSLEETPTWSVATVTTVLVFVCLFIERSIYRFGKWLKKTRRKALFASLEKIKEELMLLGLISLLLGQSASWISQICVNSSLFSSKFYLCSEEDYDKNEKILISYNAFQNETDVPPKGVYFQQPPHQCGEGREPFVSYEGLEQLHRFLFVLGVTHVLYSCVTVGLAMSKIYSWRKWEDPIAGNLLATRKKVMSRQSTFVKHHASHPWSRSRILIWMLCFLRQFRHSIDKSDYRALRLGFITNHKLPLTYNFHKYIVRSMEDEFYGIVGISWLLWGYAILCIFVNIHGLNIYFWLSFIPAINAFEMATFIWSLWGLKRRSCFMNNHAMIIIRLIFGVVVQLWCSYSTAPLNVIISQMGSRCRKALIAESVRDSLHSWYKRVKERSKGEHSVTTRSVCSVSTIDERDEIITTGPSGTLSPDSSSGSSHQLDANAVSAEQPDCNVESSDRQAYDHEHEHELCFQILEDNLQPLDTGDEENEESRGQTGAETLFQLFQRT